jgi:DNA-3-methyladenine glycosylase I
MKKRCSWAKHPLEIEYHDNEWGIPVHDDTKLFEFLLLDAFQAGLSWLTILKKRNSFRKSFDNFDYKKIAEYSEKKVNELMNNKGIIRNKLKIEASINNARKFVQLQEKYGSFDQYIWQFTQGQCLINHWEKPEDIPAQTAESQAMSKALKKEGFNFIGPTICYAFMQAAGMVNDHEISCFRHKECMERT